MLLLVRGFYSAILLEQQKSDYHNKYSVTLAAASNYICFAF